MSLSDWNWRLPADLQDVPWDCAACSTAWAMRTVGRDVTEADVVAGLGPQRITPAYGLMDASGAGLVEYLAEQGIQAANNPEASWGEIAGSAGYQPMVIGGREWCHWVGVRLSNYTFRGESAAEIALMNPAPGYRGVGQVLDQDDFDALGPFSAVWFEAW